LDVALAVSGSVVPELLMHSVPVVVAYRANIITGELSKVQSTKKKRSVVELRFHMKRISTYIISATIIEFLIKRRVTLSHASIPNIIMNEGIIPERLFSDCNPDVLAESVM
jgi:lipid A disaccharide synthetase